MKKERKHKSWSFDLPVQVFDPLFESISNPKLVSQLKDQITDGIIHIKDHADLQELQTSLTENLDSLPDSLQEAAAALLEKIADALTNSS